MLILRNYQSASQDALRQGIREGHVRQIKTCNKCKLEKDLTSFYSEKHGKFGRRGTCKDCDSVRHITYKKEHKEQAKEKRVIRDFINKEKNSKYNKEYKSSHKAESKIKRDVWKANNPDKVRVHKSNYHESHKEYVRNKCIEWRAANPHAMRTHNQNRRARKKCCGGVLSVGLKEKLLSLQKGKCACCRVPLIKVKIHMDHIIPIVKGGLNIDSNIQLLCQKCNNQKHAKDPIDFMQSKGFLC